MVKKFTDLNTLGLCYKVWAKDSERELKTLKELLSQVPIQLRFDFSQLQPEVELWNPQNLGFTVLDNAFSIDLIDKLLERISVPFPFITLYGDTYSKDFTKKNKLEELVTPVDATIIKSSSIPEGLGILYEGIYKRGQHKGKLNGQLNYIQMVLTNHRF